MRIRYGKPIKVRSMLSTSSSKNISTSSTYALVFKNWGSGDALEFRPFTEADYTHKFFCYTEFDLGTNTFTYTGFAAQGTSNSTYKANNFSLCSVNTPTATAVSLYVYGTLDNTITVKTRFMLDLTNIFGAGNEPTAQQFYEKYHRYFPVIATGEEITIDDKAGQIAYEKLNNDVIRCKIAGGSSDIYYGYNQQFIISSQTTISSDGIEIINNKDGTYTISGTNTKGSVLLLPFISVNGVQNHIYLYSSDCENSTAETFWLQNASGGWSNRSGTANAGNVTRDTPVFSVPTNTSSYSVYIYVAKDAHIESTTFTPQFIDLTDWFGSGNEPTTVAEFKQKFVKEYYGFCPTAIKLTQYQIEALPNYGYNQMIQYGDFSATGDWNRQGGTLTVNNNIGTFTFTAAGQYNTGIAKYIGSPIDGHKYILCATVKHTTAGLVFKLRQNNNYTDAFTSTTTWQTVEWMHTGTGQGSQSYYLCLQEGSTGEVVQIKNCMMFDLTEWFGSGNEPSTISEFRAMFQNKYYPYSLKRLLNKYMINKLVN